MFCCVRKNKVSDFKYINDGCELKHLFHESVRGAQFSLEVYEDAINWTEMFSFLESGNIPSLFRGRAQFTSALSPRLKSSHGMRHIIPS